MVRDVHRGADPTSQVTNDHRSGSDLYDNPPRMKQAMVADHIGGDHCAYHRLGPLPDKMTAASTGLSCHGRVWTSNPPLRVWLVDRHSGAFESDQSHVIPP